MAWKIYYEAKLGRALTDEDKRRIQRHREKWEQVRWKHDDYRIKLDPEQSNNRRTIYMGAVSLPDSGDSRGLEMEAEKVLMALGELKRSIPEFELDVQDSQGRIKYDYGRLRFVIGPPTPGFVMRGSKDPEPEGSSEPERPAPRGFTLSPDPPRDEEEEDFAPPAKMGEKFGRVQYIARRGKPLTVQEEQVIWRLQDHWWKKGEVYQDVFKPQVLSQPDDDWVVIRGTIEPNESVGNDEVLDILSHLRALLGDLQWQIDEKHGRISWSDAAGVFKEVESPLLAAPVPVSAGRGASTTRKRSASWGAAVEGFKGFSVAPTSSKSGPALGSPVRMNVSGWSFTAEKDLNNTWINVSGPLDNPFPLAAEFRAVITLRDKADRVVFVDNQSISAALQAGEAGVISGSIPLSAEIWVKVVEVHVALDYRVAGQMDVGAFKIVRS
ncbi:MAG: hypothetical protein KC609_02910 [Myxococcales bacterium]|nr:hypothetical protein [Myxococcales bacterium]